MRTKILNSFLIFSLITSCTMAPKYKRPEPNVPLAKNDEGKEIINRISWQRYFKSKDLQRVIELALKNNRDLKVANLNVEEAMATHNVVRANLMPQINAYGNMTHQKVPSSFAAFSPKNQYRAGLSLTSFEIDFLGRLQSLKKAALEDFLASEQAKKVTEITVISETANAYAQLLLDMEILEITNLSLAAQKDKYELIKLRYREGIDSKSTLLNAESAMEETKKLRDDYKKFVAADKTALKILCGNFDDNILPKNASLSDIEIDEALLDFVPSENLLLRPDVQQAEHNLKSANANIGAARAAFFPIFSLTGNAGFASRRYSTLFSSNSKTWSVTPQITIPIFNGGANFADLKISNLRKKIEVAQYEKAIQTAFKEVSDELATREAVSSQLKSANNIFAAKEEVSKISEAKYEVGLDSKMTMLDSKVSFLTTKQNYATTRKQYIANLITLYKVLGGGSEIEIAENKEKK